MQLDVVAGVDWTVKVLVDLGVLLAGFGRDVDQPIGRSLVNPSNAVLKDLFLTQLPHADVVEFAPHILVVIFDQCIVVATLRASVMDAYTVKVVGLLRQRLEDVLQQVLLLLNLQSELLDLLRSLLLLLLKHTGHELCLIHVLLLQWSEKLQVAQIGLAQRSLNRLLLALLGEEVQHLVE